MATVHDLLLQKDCAVYTIAPETSVLEATQLMNRHGIGALLVQNAEGIILGILTERDVLQRIVAVEKSPSQTPVSEAMTAEVIFCHPDTPLDHVSSILRTHRIRHLPVLDGANRLCGLISIGDLNAYHATDQEITIQYLHQYIHGRN